MQVFLSLVMPAYNEAKRLPPYLERIQSHLETIFPSRHETLVVDDGSCDGLVPLIQKQLGGWSALRLLRHPCNLGKGAALRTGLLAARGEVILFADADGATPIEEERKLRALIEQGADIAVGSRSTPTAGPLAQRTWSRGLPGHAFAWAVRRCFDLDATDTQCGFKMFRRDVAHRLCHLCREPGYLFDIEVLAWAQRRQYDQPGGLPGNGYCSGRGNGFPSLSSQQMGRENDAVVAAIAAPQFWPHS